jgi:alkylhydroperoxidase/carboxymuconolactone decarboxylase family protein YurZ
MADDATRLLEMLRAIASGDSGAIVDIAEDYGARQRASGLDQRSYAVARLAALVAASAPQASYSFMVPMARDQGLTPDEIFGVLVALLPVVGNPRIIDAATKIVRELATE